MTGGGFGGSAIALVEADDAASVAGAVALEAFGDGAGASRASSSRSPVRLAGGCSDVRPRQF